MVLVFVQARVAFEIRKINEDISVDNIFLEDEKMVVGLTKKWLLTS